MTTLRSNRLSLDLPAPRGLGTAGALALMAVLAACGGTEGDESAGTPSSGGAGVGGVGSGGAATTTGGSGGGGETVEPCLGKTCGSDHGAGMFCGAACDAGQGCSAAGECGPWPPDIDAFYDGNEGWRLPACDEGDDPGAALEGAASHYWVKTMTTTATDCSYTVQSAHPMVKVGNVATEDTAVPVHGSCVKFSNQQWGTAREGIVVWGASWMSSFYDIDYQINWRAVIDHNQSPARGQGVAHLSQLLNETCSIEMDVVYERCPEDRDDCGSHPAPF